MANLFIEDIKAKFKSGNPITQLIIINIFVFLVLSILKVAFFISGSQSNIFLFVKALALPLNFQSLLFKPWTLLTYMFTHLNLFHVLFNMLFLYWFGEILSQYSSSKKIVPLYLMGGIIGGLITLIIFSVTPLESEHLIGASAATTAIMIAAATLVPNLQVNLMLIGSVKLVYIALFLLFIDFINVSNYANLGGNLSHLAGALVGYLFINQYKKGNDLSLGINKLLEAIKHRFKNPRSKLKVAHKRPVTDEDYNYNMKVNQQEVDAILDKISKSGYESLSKLEKEKLFKESKK